MTPEQLRDEIKGILGRSQAKVWLVQNTGHRLEFLWSLGPAPKGEPVKLAEQGRFHLMGHGVEDDLLPRMRERFEAFCQGEEAARLIAADRFLTARMIHKQS